MRKVFIRLASVRKMSWVLIAWTGFCLWWAIGAGESADCDRYADSTHESACEVGTGIGLGLVFVLWFMGFIVLSLIWFMTRPKERR